MSLKVFGVKIRRISMFCLVDSLQGTGNREQETGNRKRGTGNREQGTGNREQGTGNREQEAGGVVVLGE